MRARKSGTRADAPSSAFGALRSTLDLRQRRAKRAMDIIGALTAILIVSPLLVAIGAIIRLETPGPILSRERRAGGDGRSFSICRFRTVAGAGGPGARPGEPTRFGGLLRRSGLEGLPLLFNVLNGDMSLVGPRPLTLAHKTDGDLVRLKPGMTGWAQINGLRGEPLQGSPLKRRQNLDIWYIQNWSMRLDLWILTRTLFGLLAERDY